MRGTGSNSLNDFGKTAVYIPFTPNKPTDESEETSEKSDWDLRVVAYKDAWKKCLGRMQQIVLQLVHTSAREIVKEVRMAYDEVLPGLPHPELPVVSIINPTFGSGFLTNITLSLAEYRCNVIELYPADFPNLITGMRSIISAFVQKTEVPQRIQRKAGTALASYDIKLLVAWYEAWTMHMQDFPNLVVVLHDFEQIDPSIMQDVFDICSNQVPRLPLVFVLSMTNPSSNYLNATYPRSTLSLLRVRSFTALTGQNILNEVLLGTFFDLDFQPPLMIGPTTIQYLQEHFSRYHASVDTIFTIVQLAYMKHFATEFLSIFTDSTPSIDTLQDYGLEELRKHISLSTGRQYKLPNQKQQELLSAVDQARVEFQESLQKMRLSLQILLQVQTLLQQQGHTGISLSTRENKKTVVDVTLDVLQNKENQQLPEKLLNLICNLGKEDLDELLEGIYRFLSTSQSASKYAKLRSELVTMRARIHTANLEQYTALAADVSDWIEDIINEGSMKLEEHPLWEVWYTGLTPFPRELLNPSIRASLMAGLLRPFEFEDDGFNTASTEQQEPKPIALLPDTSILFKRYLDSGKMINVYDWFESFKSVLDTQSEALRQQEEAEKGGKGKEKEKEKGKSKGKSKAKGKSAAARAAERDEEKWNLEVQARFIRALHELDYLGFIKHTGRKVDHVQRTVFDIAE